MNIDLSNNEISLVDLVIVAKYVTNNCSRHIVDKLNILLDSPAVYTNFQYMRFFNYIIMQTPTWGISNTPLKDLIKLYGINHTHRLVLSDNQKEMYDLLYIMSKTYY